VRAEGAKGAAAAMRAARGLCSRGGSEQHSRHLPPVCLTHLAQRAGAAVAVHGVVYHVLDADEGLALRRRAGGGGGKGVGSASRQRAAGGGSSAGRAGGRGARPPRRAGQMSRAATQRRRGRRRPPAAGGGAGTRRRRAAADPAAARRRPGGPARARRPRPHLGVGGADGGRARHSGGAGGAREPTALGLVSELAPVRSLSLPSAPPAAGAAPAQREARR